MFYQVLEDLAEMDRVRMHDIYFSIAQRSPNTLERVYMEMLNMPDVSKEDICREFIRARISFPLIVGLGDLDLAEGMISWGIDVNEPTIRNNRALHMACLQGDLKMAELLLKNNADANASDGTNRTPLMSLFIAMRGRWLFNIDDCYQMTRLLVSYGAKLGPLDMESIAIAVECANLDTVMLLVNEANGDLNYRSDISGESCLHLAVSNVQPGVLEYVIRAFKGDLDPRNENGWTPLLQATLTNFQNLKAVKTLLKSGADFRVRYNQRLTSFDLLLGGEHKPELAWLYFDLGLDVMGSKVKSLHRAVRLTSPWTLDIVAEIARKEMMGVLVVGNNRLVFCRDDTARSYLRVCKNQLRKMQKMKFYGDVSFWDVLSGDRARSMEYAKNLELVNAFFQTKCNGLFPIYCARMRHKFIDMVSRNILIDVCSLVVCETIKRPIMYEIMQHEVMIHLENEDFVELLSCCR
ncbi:hypothetical protein TSAR_010760 [Trichomalopsis sarcophagae]|uniref:Uncharacterized protein n=1 Tax=Trichomalopsis sarcophagae TaxID=543379 RepID=A0A232ETW4_9HYME|nr:hypothetical protein TSAR_010760 [Trichomalopsis sarcophagae]